jgi:hypothetical protein
MIRMLILIVCAFPIALHAQVTLIKGAPSETFDLNCATCRITVADIAIVPGHQVMPYNLAKEPPKVNLAHWRYFDKILNRQNVWPRPLYGEECFLLLNDLALTDTVSVHINLTWQADSVGPIHRAYLLIGGVQRQELSTLPLSTAYSDELFSAKRLSAIVQVVVPPTDKADGYTETYEITEGTMTLEKLDFTEDQIQGSFDILTNRVGMVKIGVFKSAKFQR